MKIACTTIVVLILMWQEIYFYSVSTIFCLDITVARLQILVHGIHSIRIDFVASKLRGHLAVVITDELAARKTAVVHRRMKANLFSTKACGISVFNRNVFGGQRGQIEVTDDAATWQQITGAGSKLWQGRLH